MIFLPTVPAFFRAADLSEALPFDAAPILLRIPADELKALLADGRSDFGPIAERAGFTRGHEPPFSVDLDPARIRSMLAKVGISIERGFNDLALSGALDTWYRQMNEAAPDYWAIDLQGPEGRAEELTRYLGDDGEDAAKLAFHALVPPERWSKRLLAVVGNAEILKADETHCSGNRSFLVR